MPYMVALRLVDREGVLHPPGYASVEEEWPADDVEGSGSNSGRGSDDISGSCGRGSGGSR